MKNSTLALLLMICTHAGLAQSASPVIHLVYDYVNVGLGEKRTASLLFRNQESLSVFSAKDSIGTGSSPKDFEISGEDPQGRQVYKNTITHEVIFRDFVPQDGDFYPCVVDDPMPPLKWTYSPETRRIGKYLCKTAATEFRGRKYVAWYTEDIPVSHGPWKFYGLPGAVIEVYSTDRNIVFSLARVGTLPAAEISRPLAENNISMVEYVSRHEKATTDFINSLAAKLPRGAQISATTTNDYNLEIDFSDVKR